MAKILSVAIKGIRSFGPNEKDTQNITFEAPVTLILGENGCGKTTIIESLKYACTGKPPSVKKNFLYRPELGCLSKTKGTVELKLTDISNQEITIRRSLSTTNEKPKASDNTLTIKTAAGDVLPTHGIRDIKEVVIERLGVSEAILNNVIFCHHDDSLWPMGKDGEVKANFDKFFDATNYNKCIESMREQQKDLKKDLESKNTELLSVKANKDYVESQEAQLQTLLSQVTRLDNEIASIEEQIILAKDNLVKHNNLSLLRQELSKKESDREIFLQSEIEIREKIKEEFEGTDEEFKDEIKQFTEKLRNLPSLDQINKDLEACSSSSKEVHVRLGALQTEKKLYDEKITTRDEQIQNLFLDLGLSKNLTHDRKRSVEDALAQIETALYESKSSIDKLHEDESQIQKSIDKSREEVVKVGQMIASNESQIQDRQKKIRKVEDELTSLGTSDEELKQLDKELDDLKKLNESTDTEAIEQCIKQDQIERQKLEENLEYLESDYKILQQNLGCESEIETRRKDISDRETKICELNSRHQGEFMEIFGEIRKNNLQQQVENVLDENNDIVSTLQKQIDQKKMEVTKYEANIDNSNQKLESYKDELEKHTNKISAVTNNKNFEALCTDLEVQLDNRQKLKGQLSSSVIMYEEFVRKFESETPCCPVCHTDFNNRKSAAAEIIKKIKDEISHVPARLNQVEEELKRFQKQFNEVQQLKPIYEKVENLKSNLIPDVNKEIENFNEKYKTSNDEKVTLMEQIQKPKQLVDTCSKLLPDAALIDKYQNDVSIYKIQIEDLQNNLQKIDSDKSKEEIEGAIHDLKKNISQKRQLFESNQKKINHLKENYNRTFEKRVQLEKSMHEKTQLLQKEKELKNEEVKLKNDTKQLKDEMDSLQKTFAKCVNDLKILKEGNEKKNRKAKGNAQ